LPYAAHGGPPGDGCICIHIGIGKKPAIAIRIPDDPHAIDEFEAFLEAG
jgi:hypothetical protein